jgi:hypothetical protein
VATSCRAGRRYYRLSSKRKGSNKLLFRVGLTPDQARGSPLLNVKATNHGAERSTIFL